MREAFTFFLLLGVEVMTEYDQILHGLRQLVELGFPVLQCTLVLTEHKRA